MALPTEPNPPETPATPATTPPQVARLPRRLGALLYDSVLLFALLLLATALLIVPYDLLAARPYPQDDWLYRTLFQAYLLAVILGFFVYFWTHGGQTLGMSAWRLRVVRDDGRPLRTREALRRCAFAAVSLLPAGLGLWWCLFDREHLTWHDRRSRTRVIVVPRGR